MTTKAMFRRTRKLSRRLDKAKALLEYFGKRKAYRRSILRALKACDAILLTWMETEGDDALVREAFDRALRSVRIVEALSGATWNDKLVPSVN